MRRIRICLLLVTAVTLSGCIAVPVRESSRGHGPPRHAPAHGHRTHHHGAELIFDAGLGLYLVGGRSHYYFHSDQFFRLHDGVWQVSARVRGPWRPYQYRALPAGLRKAHPHQAHRHKAHRHRGYGHKGHSHKVRHRHDKRDDH